MKLHKGEKPYISTKCNIAFPVKFQLQYHLINHTGDRPYHWWKCNKAFSMSIHLKCNLKSQTGGGSHIIVTCVIWFSQYEIL